MAVRQRPPQTTERRPARLLQCDAAPVRHSPEPGAVPDSRVQWQRMTVTGTYRPEAEMVARLWTVQRKSDAFKVLTPLRATTGAVVLIDRGYLRPDARTGTAGRPHPHRRHRPAAGRLRRCVDGRRLQSHAVDSPVMARDRTARPAPLLQLDPGQPGVLAALSLPQITDGSLNSYGNGLALAPCPWQAGCISPSANSNPARHRARRRPRAEDEFCRWRSCSLSATTRSSIQPAEAGTRTS